MEVFKIKKIKEVPKEQGGTLDAVHREILDNFQKEDSSNGKEISQLEEEIQKLSASSDVSASIKIFKLEEKIKKLKNTEKLQNKVENYYLDNADIFMKYYDETARNVKYAQDQVAKDTNTFMRFFADRVTSQNVGVSKKHIFDEYMVRMKLSAGQETTQILQDHCHDCNVAREEITGEGILVCPKCGGEEYALIVNDVPAFNDPPKERNNYAYKKGNHLNEILNQFQAKESTIIPDDLMNDIFVEIKKRRITEVGEDDIREILKKLGKSKYYEHQMYILSRVNGHRPPVITPEIEEKIRAMFQEIQTPFLIHCPSDRTNFLSYSYILYKFIELLELDEYKAFFPLLKSRDRRIQHDVVWKKICEDLKWEFIPSV
jgi:uncharacterized Zn finger protein (UPF0148 family)